MIKFIIGQNASGKTLFLDNKIRNRLSNTDKLDFVTNIDLNNSFKFKDYDEKRIEILEEITQVDSIDTSSEYIVPLNSPIKLSKNFLYLMTILCKDVTRAYIDEPEQGLSEYEIGLLCSFLQLTDNTFEEVFIVTHSEVLIQLPYCEIYSVEMDSCSSDVELIVVSEEEKFEIID